MGRETYQTRSAHSAFETREDSGKLFISGYFAVFDSEYEIFPGATESVDPSAFDGALSDDIRGLVDHETRLVLGRNKANTMTLEVTSRGLWGEIEINQNDTDAMNLYERVKRGDVSQCSFGFDILEETFEDRGATVHWTIKKVKLYEVSVVTFPAYTDTSVTARKKQLDSIKKRSAELRKNNILKKLKGD